MTDDDGNVINLGDTLESEWGYKVVVVALWGDDEDQNGWVGRLVAEPDHSCINIPYALNGGRGHKKVKVTP